MASDHAHGPLAGSPPRCERLSRRFPAPRTLDGTRRGVQHRPPEASRPASRETGLVARV